MIEINPQTPHFIKTLYIHKYTPKPSTPKEQNRTPPHPQCKHKEKSKSPPTYRPNKTAFYNRTTPKLTSKTLFSNPNQILHTNIHKLHNYNINISNPHNRTLYPSSFSNYSYIHKQTDHPKKSERNTQTILQKERNTTDKSTEKHLPILKNTPTNNITKKQKLQHLRNKSSS